MTHQIINTKQITGIFIETNSTGIGSKDINTVIRLMTKTNDNSIKNIIIPGQHDEFMEQIETLILNSFNDKLFISRHRLEKSIIDRLAQAKKTADEYKDKE